MVDFNEEYVRAAIAAHKERDFDEVAYQIGMAFTWSDSTEGHDFWENVSSDLTFGNPREDAIAILKGWLEPSHDGATMESNAKPAAAVAVRKLTEKASSLSVEGTLVNRDYLSAALYHFTRGRGGDVSMNLGSFSAQWSKLPGGDALWHGAYDALLVGNITPDVEEVMKHIRKALGEPSAAELTEDRVHGWAHERGLALVDAKELKQLRRHGKGDVPEFNRATYDKLTRGM